MTESSTATTQEQGSATFPAPDPKKHYFWGTGRRKTAVARVRLRAGTGKFEINKRPMETYFTEDKGPQRRGRSAEGDADVRES